MTIGFVKPKTAEPKYDPTPRLPALKVGDVVTDKQGRKWRVTKKGPWEEVRERDNPEDDPK